MRWQVLRALSAGNQPLIRPEYVAQPAYKELITHTRVVHVHSRHAASVTAGLVRELGQLPDQAKRSLTWDRGMELAGHKEVAAGTGMKVYFADPHSPWQRGTNENTNRLLRQYFPKKTSMKGFSQADLDEVADKLNNRPRKILGFRTPTEQYEVMLR